MILSISVMVVVAFFTGIGQLLMKKAALRKGSFISRFFSPPFIGACFFFLLCPPLSIIAAWKLPFAVWMSLTALNYIAVLILARIFLKEHLDRPKVTGAVLIIIGLLLMIFI